MKQSWLILLVLPVVCGCGRSPGLEIRKIPPLAKAPESISLDTFRSTPPQEWEEKPPVDTAGLNRHAVFELPRAAGEGQEPASLVIFKGIGGEVEGNLDRWRRQFEKPTEKLDEEFTIAGRPGARIELKGTFLEKKAPMVPGGETLRREKYEMIAIYWEGPQNTYQIVLRGPIKTVEENRKSFDKWLKEFK